MFKVYESKNYKLLLIVPLIILGISIFYASQVEFGVDLRGGILLTAQSPNPVDIVDFTEKLETNFNLDQLDVRALEGSSNGIFLEFAGEISLLEAEAALQQEDYATVVSLSKKFTGELEATGSEKDVAEVYYATAREDFKNSLVAFISQELGISIEAFSIQDVGSALGASFFEQAKTSLLVAFIFISLLIFFYFRNLIVSFAVVQSAFFDVLAGYAALGFFNIPLSLATIAPLLMLIGYSVDTDIMLTDRILKRKEGTPFDRLRGAFRTGITMTMTTIFAILSLAIVSWYSNILILFNISLVLLVGLLADLIGTWFTNAVLLVWFVKRSKK